MFKFGDAGGSHPPLRTVLKTCGITNAMISWHAKMSFQFFFLFRLSLFLSM